MHQGSSDQTSLGATTRNTEKDRLHRLSCSLHQEELRRSQANLGKPRVRQNEGFVFPHFRQGLPRGVSLTIMRKERICNIIPKHVLPVD